MSQTTPEALRGQVEEALRTVIDPELGLNVVDLGLVYRIEVAGHAVEVDLTMTTAACPLGEQILLDAQDKVSAVARPGCERRARYSGGPAPPLPRARIAAKPR